MVEIQQLCVIILGLVSCGKSTLMRNVPKWPDIVNPSKTA